MVIERGSVYWADLGAVVLSAPAKRRPVVVMQSDSFNRSEIATVVVAGITSNTALADYRGNVFVPASASGLPRDSVVNVSALTAIPREEIQSRVGALPAYLIGEVEAGVRLVLAL